MESVPEFFLEYIPYVKTRSLCTTRILSTIKEKDNIFRYVSPYPDRLYNARILHKKKKTEEWKKNIFCLHEEKNFAVTIDKIIIDICDNMKIKTISKKYLPAYISTVHNIFINSIYNKTEKIDDSVTKLKQALYITSIVIMFQLIDAKDHHNLKMLQNIEINKIPRNIVSIREYSQELTAAIICIACGKQEGIQAATQKAVTCMHMNSDDEGNAHRNIVESNYPIYMQRKSHLYMRR